MNPRRPICSCARHAVVANGMRCVLCELELRAVETQRVLRNRDALIAACEAIVGCPLAAVFK